MLRITVHENLEFLTFQLEGKLAGAWVREVEECRQRTLSGRRWPAVRFDLTGVIFIDAAGKAYLAAMPEAKRPVNGGRAKRGVVGFGYQSSQPGVLVNCVLMGSPLTGVIVSRPESPFRGTD